LFEELARRVIGALRGDFQKDFSRHEKLAVLKKIAPLEGVARNRVRARGMHSPSSLKKRGLYEI
jgi:hypothetical protein